MRVATAGDAALVTDGTTAVLVGPPDPELLRAALVDGVDARELLVEHDAATTARGVLPGWRAREFVVHTLAGPYADAGPPAPGVIVSCPLDPAVLRGLPDDVRADAAEAPAAAVRFVDETPVAVCAVSDRTGSLWDVGIDTVESARRQGHATAVFTALATTMADQGRHPVWAAYADYPPSLRLAARLGFRPILRMTELVLTD